MAFGCGQLTLIIPATPKYVSGGFVLSSALVPKPKGSPKRQFRCSYDDYPNPTNLSIPYDSAVGL